MIKKKTAKLKKKNSFQCRHHYPRMKILVRFSFVLLLMITSAPSFAQKLVLDTLLVKCNPDSLAINLSLPRIDTVYDERGVDDPALLDWDEKKQYIFIPVDQKILAHRPVAEVIQNALKAGDENSGECIRLGLAHLDFSDQKQFLFRNVFRLHASLFVYEKDKAVGELVYRCQSPRWFRGLKIRRRYQSLIGELVRRIGSDLNGKNSIAIQNLANCRMISKQNPWMQLQAGSEMTLLTDGDFIIDGYLTFVYPEIRKRWIQSVGTMRYRHMDRFESIEWGLTSDWMMQRYHPDWALRFKSQLMIGINRWKDMKTYKHKLYDVFLLDLSLGQSLHYVGKNRRSITLGLGLIENVYYIHSTGIRIDAGLMIQAGVQF